MILGKNESRRLTNFSSTSHDHDGVYEPVFTILSVAKGGTGRNTLTSGYILLGNGTGAITMTAPATAFNKAFGTSSGQVAQGNHNHSGVYEPVFSKNTAFNKNFAGSGAATTPSRSDHNHSGVYEPYDLDIVKSDVAETITAQWTFSGTIQGATTFASTVTATNFIDASDRELKQNIKEFSSRKFGDVNFVEYELKANPGIKQYGVIAQEIGEIYPEVVYFGSDGMLGVDYRSLSVIGLQKVQELERLLNTSIWRLILIKIKKWFND